MTIKIRADKKKILALTVVLALTIALIGTFAWNSFNQSRINVFKELISHDVNLHDDFEGGPNKDVYVENSGKFPIFVRIKLTEYLETVNRGSLLANSVRGEDDADDALAFARDTWAPHNGYDHLPYEFPEQQSDAAISRPPEGEFWAIGDMWPSGEYFPDYYEWIMGGEVNSWIYYKPATEEQRGKYDEAGNPLEDGLPQVVVDYDGMAAALEELGIADAHEYYKILMAEELATNGGDEALAMETLGLKKTQATVSVITMDDWMDESFSPKTGKFWVVDSDGWCYWAEPLEGGEATGLLLDKVDRTSKLFDSNAEYAINVWLQAVDESELTDMLTMEANGGSTSNAKKLMNIAAGKITLIGANSYVKNRDGTFSAANDNGELLTGDDAKTIIPIGAANMEGSAFKFQNDDAGNILKIGQYFTMTDLIWDGEDYANFEGNEGGLETEEQWTGTATAFNMTLLDDLTEAEADSTTGYVTKDDNQVYIITGVTEGRDGQRYLTVAPALNPTHSGTTIDGDVIEGQKMYLASVARSGGAGSVYSQTTPGTGPWGLIFPATPGGAIGTASDLRCDPAVLLGAMHLYHIGNGIYVEVAAEGDTTAKDADPTYYFAGKMLPKKELFAKTESDLGTLFPVQMKAGDKFDATFTEVGSTKVNRLTVQYAKAEEGEFTFNSLVKGANGQYYIYLGSSQAGYIGVGDSKFLTTVNGTTGDVRTWAGSGGIGTTGDKIQKPDIFGTGTQADPFIITSRTEMNFISQQVNSGITYAGIFFEVANDFDMGSTPFAPVGARNKPFRGNFNGKGYTISGLTTNTTAELQGLFGWVDSAGVIYDVKLASVNVKGGANTGAIAGYNGGLIEKCSVESGTVIVTGNAGSTVVGYNQGTVRNCESGATLNNTSGIYQGGIVGINAGGASVTENCTFTGTINSNGNYVGGVVGYNQGKVTNCSNSGTILPTNGQYIGGVVGESYGPVTDCINSGVIGAAGNRRSHVGGVIGVNYHTLQDSQNLAEGKVFGTQYVGGIVGLNNQAANAKIINCTNAAPIDGSSTFVGGIVGNNIGTVQNCQNNGTVTGAGVTGGIAGQNNSNSNILGSSNTVKVTGTGGNTGGLVGVNVFNIDGSFNTGVVEGTTAVGGLVGYHSGTSAMLKLSYNHGNVSGSANRVGGAIGSLNWSKIQQTYNSGNVTGTTEVGGLTGYLYDACPITNCYAIGTVTGTAANAKVGGIVGYAQPYSASYYSTLTNVYSDSPLYAGGGGTANVGGIVGTYGPYTRMTNAVALMTQIGSTGTRGTIYGAAGGIAPANVYYNSSINGVTATGVSMVRNNMNQAWWQNTAKVSADTNVWEWNASLNRPVLKGLPVK